MTFSNDLSANRMALWGKLFIPLLIPASGLIQLVTKSLWMCATQAGLGQIIIHKLAVL